MKGHKEWIKFVFDDGDFLLADSLQYDPGDSIIAHTTSPADLHRRVNDDPYIVEPVVCAWVLQKSPHQ
jgi:hypothetical protein